MPTPHQEPPASPSQDLKDMDLLCTFKIKIESQNSEHGCIKDSLPYTNQYQDAEPESTKAPNQELKDIDVLCTFKIKIDSQNSEHECTKDE